MRGCCTLLRLDLAAPQLIVRRPVADIRHAVSMTIDTLIVETGCSNIIVGTSEPYVPTSTSEDTGETVVRFRPPYFIGTRPKRRSVWLRLFWGRMD